MMIQIQNRLKIVEDKTAKGYTMMKDEPPYTVQNPKKNSGWQVAGGVKSSNAEIPKICRNGNNQIVYFSPSFLEFLRDMTSTLPNNAEFQKFCVKYRVHPGALVRQLRKTYRGKTYDGVWWWSSGLQQEFPAPNRA